MPHPGHPATSPARPRSVASAIVAILALTLALAACSSSGSDSTTKAEATTTTAKATTTLTPAEKAAEESLVKARPVKIEVPSGYDKAKPAPLVVLLHGYGANGSVQSAYFKMSEAADSHGMLFVAPDGTKNPIGLQFWNATDACCGGPKGTPGRDVDDSAYLDAVIHHVQSQYAVDPKQIFFVGHSNGGFMSFRMACDHADEIAAIVSIEGSTFEDPKACSPSEPVAVLAVHGTADRTIPYDGGDILGKEYPSAPTTAKTWATYDGCSTKANAKAASTRAIVKDKPPATATVYDEGCRPGGHAELWTQPEGVHIPVWTDDFSKQILDWLQDHPKP